MHAGNRAYCIELTIGSGVAIYEVHGVGGKILQPLPVRFE